MNLPDTQIAVTLYNLRNYCQTESDLDQTFDKICAMGYRAIQVSGTKLPAEVIRKQMDSHGLVCIATHEGFLEMCDTARLVDRLRTLNCDFAAMGSMPLEFRGGNGQPLFARLDEFIATVNEKCAALKEQGIRFGYHNHDFEFMHLANGQTMLEYFYEHTDPACVCAEIDVHWVTRGGGSPATWIRKVAGRMPVVHFKDFARLEDGPHFCEVGEGNLDWPEILKACRETNVRWYSIEQDKEVPGRNIFDSVKISYDNLKKMGVK